MLNFSSPAGWMGQDCVLCAAPSHAHLVCNECVAALPRFQEHVLRGNARYDGVVAAYEYRFPVDRLVQRFKYAGDLAIGRWLALELARRVQAERRPHLFVPMPLTNTRLRERGFNQAAQVALVLSARLRVPAALRMVERVRDAPSQSRLGRRARRANLRGAFRCAASLRDKDVVLVDDVITTGASAEAVCGVLKRAGARRVDVWALARTPDPGAR